MITRTTIGADFEGALTYGAGVRQGDSPKKQAELIGSSNLVDIGNPRGLAAEMQGTADERTKCKNPVWHTSLSWAKGEHLSTEQKLQAAELYCELLRSQLSKKMPEDERAAYNVWEQHQVAVYEHHDKDHEHIHIYLNRVPVYGGPAIETGHNYKFNLKAIQLISEELNLNPLPSQRQSIKDSRPPVQDTRQAVKSALVEALANPQLQSIEQLREHLAGQAIEMRTKRSQAGQLVGVSFKQGEAAVTGQEVGMKAAQLREHYEPRQVQAQAQVQQPVAAQQVPEAASSQAPQVVPAEVPAQLVDQAQQAVAADVAREQEKLRQALTVVLATATNGGTLRAGLEAQGIGYRIDRNEAGQNVSMSFGFNQGPHIFEGAELSPAYSLTGIMTLLQSNRETQQQRAVAAEAARAQERERLGRALAVVLATATNTETLVTELKAQGIGYRIEKNEAGQRMSFGFTRPQGVHVFESTELNPAYSMAGMGALMKANRPAQQQPAAQLVPEVASSPAQQPAAPEQRPVAAQPPAPEQKPQPAAPTLKPEPPKQAPPKKKGPRLR